MQSILNNAWVQGGAILLLIVILVLAVGATFKYIVLPLWKDNKELRTKVFEMTERQAVTGEAQRATNNNVAEALKDLAQEQREQTRAIALNTACTNEVLVALRSSRR